MKKTIITSITTLILAIILLINASAFQEAFSINAPAEIAVYKCSPASGTLTVANTGDVSSTYSLSIEGKASDWTTILPASFTLNPGYQQTVNYYFAVPCSAKGKNKLITHISTLLDEQIVEQALVVYMPENIELTPKVFSQSIEPCQKAEFVLGVRNPINFTETYTFSIDKFLNESLLSENTITLPPGQSRDITLSVTPKDCTKYGSFPILFTASTEKTMLKAELELSLEIKPTNIPEIKVPELIRTNYSRSTHNASITNKGDKTTKYLLSIKGIDWAFVESILTVAPKETKTIPLTIAPKNGTPEGIYHPEFVAKVDGTGAEYSSELHIALKEPTLLDKLFTKYLKYTLSGIVLGMILLIAVSIAAVKLTRYLASDEYKKKRAERKRLNALERARKERQTERKRLEKELEKEHKKELKHVARKEVRKEAKSKWPGFGKGKWLKLILWLVFLAVVAAAAYGAYYYRALIKANWYYAAGGVALLLIILAAKYILSDEYKKKKLELQREKERKKKEKWFERERLRLRKLVKGEYRKEYFLVAKKEIAKRLKISRETGSNTKLFVSVILLAIVAGLGYYFRKQLWQYFYYTLGAVGILALLGLWKWLRRNFVVEQRWKLVVKDHEETMPVGWRTGIGQINFRLSAPAKKLALRVAKAKGKKAYSAPGEHVYQYFNAVANIGDENFSKTSYNFRVDKRWLARKGIREHEVKLVRLANGKWQGVGTDKVGEDKRFVYYQSITDCLGQFAIVGKSKPKEKKSISSYIVLGILIVAAIGLIYYSSQKEEPVVVKGIPPQVWTQDTIKTIDLTKYFKDPDSDVLEFKATPLENIDILIDNGVAILTPEPGWVGQGTVMFTADDGKGGVVESNPVKLLVRKTQVPEFVKSNIAYILAGVIFLTLIILFIQFRKPIVKFLQD